MQDRQNKYSKLIFLVNLRMMSFILHFRGAVIRLLHLCYYNGDSTPPVGLGAGHACSMSPNHIREEVDILQGDK